MWKMDQNHLIQGIEPTNEIVKWHCREYSNSELFHSFFKRKFFDQQKSRNRKIYIYISLYVKAKSVCIQYWSKIFQYLPNTY